MPYLIDFSADGLPSNSASYDYGTLTEPRSWSGRKMLLRDFDTAEPLHRLADKKKAWAFEPLDSTLLPDHVVFKKVLERQRDFEYVGGVESWMLSEKFCQLIEDLEPGVHQFIPMETVGLDGAPTPVRYRLLIVQRYAFTVDVYDSPQVTVKPPGGPWNIEMARLCMPPKDGSPGLILFGARVGNMHLWCEVSRTNWSSAEKIHFDLVPRLMVSDQLMAAMKKHDILGARTVATGVFA